MCFSIDFFKHGVRRMGNVSVPVLSFSGIIVFWNVYFLFLWDATKCAFQLTSSNTELGAWEMYLCLC